MCTWRAERAVRLRWEDRARGWSEWWRRGCEVARLAARVGSGACAHRDADDVEAHRDDVLRRRAVVARAHVALERRREVAALRVEVAEVVVPHPDRLLHQRRLVVVQLVLEPLELVHRLLVLGVDPRVVALERVARDREQLGVLRRVRRALHLVHREPERLRLERGRRGGDEGEALEARDAGVIREVGLEVHRAGGC